MSEEEAGSFESIFHNKLKDVDVKTLEKAIAKTVSDLIGAELICTIDTLTYERKSYSFTGADIVLSLSEPYKGIGTKAKTET